MGEAMIRFRIVNSRIFLGVNNKGVVLVVLVLDDVTMVVPDMSDQ
tara:strand:- start:122 stop:256 length:135 start_codon:yes stop_codon:yes gene_type:complete